MTSNGKNQPKNSPERQVYFLLPSFFEISSRYTYTQIFWYRDFYIVKGFWYENVYVMIGNIKKSCTHEDEARQMDKCMEESWIDLEFSKKQLAHSEPLYQASGGRMDGETKDKFMEVVSRNKINNNNYQLFWVSECVGPVARRYDGFGAKSGRLPNRLCRQTPHESGSHFVNAIWIR